MRLFIIIIINSLFLLFFFLLLTLLLLFSPKSPIQAMNAGIKGTLEKSFIANYISSNHRIKSF